MFGWPSRFWFPVIRHAEEYVASPRVAQAPTDDKIAQSTQWQTANVQS